MLGNARNQNQSRSVQSENAIHCAARPPSIRQSLFHRPGIFSLLDQNVEEMVSDFKAFSFFSRQKLSHKNPSKLFFEQEVFVCHFLVFFPNNEFLLSRHICVGAALLWNIFTQNPHHYFCLESAVAETYNVLDWTNETQILPYRQLSLKMQNVKFSTFNIFRH